MKKLKVLKKETYLTMIGNAEGTKLFRCLFAEEDGDVKELLGGGRRSCAVFVSSVLYLFDLVLSPRATVASLERDLIQSGWSKTSTPNPGDILFWEPRLRGGRTNAHVGFYLGNDRAISNDWRSHVPKKHRVTFGEGSKDGIVAMYTHDFLLG